MAECHPVGFQWVMEAKARGATVIHIDPRFTRTSAVADLHVPLRAGSRHRAARRADQLRAEQRASTSATTCVELHQRGDDHRARTSADTEDLDGLFSGFDPDSRHLRPEHLDSTRAPRCRPRPASGTRSTTTGPAGDVAERSRTARPARAARRTARAARTSARRSTDPTLEHPRCVFQILKRHFARYTPEMVEQACGIPPDAFGRVCDADHAELRPGADDRVRLQRRLDPAHRRRAVHPRRVDPADAARQHRPAGRRHPGAARARLDPGLHRHPDAVRPAARLHPDAARAHQRGPGRFVAAEGTDKGFWANMRAYTVSLLKAWWGDAATADERLLLRLPAAADRQPLAPTRP